MYANAPERWRRLRRFITPVARSLEPAQADLGDRAKGERYPVFQEPLSQALPPARTVRGTLRTAAVLASTTYFRAAQAS
jgi:hypothetical protein